MQHGRKPGGGGGSPQTVNIPFRPGQNVLTFQRSNVERFRHRLFARRLASQFREFSLLLGRQLVLDSHKQCDLLFLDFSFRCQHFFQLRKNLLLVHAWLLDQGDQFLHFILQLPLQLREFQLCLADFCLEIIFLLGAQPNRFLVLDHKFRSKEALTDRILIGLLRAGRSRGEEKRRANAENSPSHFIPPHPSSREHSDRILRASAWPAKSPAPESPADHRWVLAILLVSARRQVRPPESFALFSVATSPQSSEPQQPLRSLRLASTLATAAHAFLHGRSRPQLALAPGNPPTALRLAPPAAEAHPIAPRALEPPPAQRSISRSFVDALQDQLSNSRSARPPAMDHSIFRMHSSFHRFQQKFPRRVQPRSNRPRWNSKHRPHVGGLHLFNQRKLQDSAKFLRQPFYFSPEPVQHLQLLRILRSVRHHWCFCHLPGCITSQPAPVVSLAVQSQPKNNPVHPRAEFLRFPQRCKLLVGAQERFLCGIFCVGGISQNAVGNLENAPLILSNALAKSRLGIMRFGSGNQRSHARACHASLTPFRIDTAARPFVQENSTPGRTVKRANRTTCKIPVARCQRARDRHPAACCPLGSEEKYRLKRRKNRLQLSCNLHGLKFLQLLSVEDGHELREKGLLCLRHLLLQRVNLDDQDSHLCRVPVGIQQIRELLDERLGRLKQRHKRSLACLQQLLQFAHLAGPQLQ